MSESIAFTRSISENTNENARSRTAAIYAEHHGFILSVCKGILRDQEEAKEAAQEVFIKVLTSLAGFEGLCQVKTWVYRIAINECFTRVSARKRKRDRLSQYAQHRSIEEEAGSVAGHVPLLAQGLFRKHLRMAGEATRKVLNMYVDQGLSQRDIADCMGVSRVAITRRITRFREVLADGRPAGLRKQPTPDRSMVEMRVRQVA
ncbi:MAG: RNA polymerase sigma factor [Fibrobacteria bacterium]